MTTPDLVRRADVLAAFDECFDARETWHAIRKRFLDIPAAEPATVADGCDVDGCNEPGLVGVSLCAKHTLADTAPAPPPASDEEFEQFDALVTAYGQACIDSVKQRQEGRIIGERQAVLAAYRARQGTVGALDREAMADKLRAIIPQPEPDGYITGEQAAAAIDAIISAGRGRA